MTENESDFFVDDAAEQALEILVNNLEERLRRPFENAAANAIEHSGLQGEVEELKLLVKKSLETSDRLRQKNDQLLDEIEQMRRDLSRKALINDLREEVGGIVASQLTPVVDQQKVIKPILLALVALSLLFGAGLVTLILMALKG